MDFDDINKLGKPYKNRAVSYDEYFEPMDLTDEQKEERVSFSEDAEDTIMFILALISVMSGFDSVDEDYLTETLTTSYLGVIGAYTGIDEYLEIYASEFATDFIGTTLENIEDVWYLSNDRAMFNAENEANTVLNYKDYVNAIASGKTMKTWVTFGDSRVRKTHRAVDGKTIPIKDLFEVGKAFMRFAKDTSMAQNHPEEIISCRCSVEYN